MIMYIYKIILHDFQTTTFTFSYARDTRMENRTVCHTIRFLSYEVGWVRMELDGTRSDPYNVISSLLEKDNIICAHCFKKWEEHGFTNNQL